MARCYFQGCTADGSTKEHVPPKSFFPKEQREQLLTVPSCEKHNTGKSKEDLYVLAHICMNASPSNGAREHFKTKVIPQLGYGDGAFRETLAGGSVRLPDGSVKYRVDIGRVDAFFDALSFGIVSKSQKAQLPPEYTVRHIYHNFTDDDESETFTRFVGELGAFYDKAAQLDVLKFGAVKALNDPIYAVQLFGYPGFRSSITVRHVFFGVFRVTSMLTRHMSEGEGSGEGAERVAR